MRIISGKAKGKKLLAPPGRKVRPTLDRVREALFSSLGSRVEGALVLDLFAGSGALGLEALSRGAAYAVFVEQSKPVQEVVRRNISQLGFDAVAKLIAGEATRTLKLLEKRGESFDLVFLDPPYGPSKKPNQPSLLDRTLLEIASKSLLRSAGIVVAEHPRETTLDFPDTLRKLSTKGYGDTGLTVLEWQG
ncbi:MAG: 16S rRNA (guanine(966)-N(2))-methyltransferase RsmD [Proteobacteria bacterium]|nr:16S rRNA (guanine(966)-N(2))-methyltransferase RsmD [Pseudomonadota bacterium]